jgi:hypothetical protein
MDIYVPFTKLQTATRIALIGYSYKPIKLIGEHAYSYYFRKRWTEGRAFINIEHDIVPCPGAIEAIEQCDHDWCLYNYSLPVHRLQNLEEIKSGAMPLGLVKISANLIAKTPKMWNEPIGWSLCDKQLTDFARMAGFSVHQHQPSVVNANPVLLGLVK